VGLLWSKLEQIVAQIRQEHHFQTRVPSSWVNDPSAWQAWVDDRTVESLSPSNYLALLWARGLIEVRFRPKPIGSEHEVAHQIADAGVSDRQKVRFTMLGEFYRRSHMPTIYEQRGGVSNEYIIGYDVQVRLTSDPARPSGQLTPADLANVMLQERRIRLVYSVWAMNHFPAWTAAKAFDQTRSCYKDQFNDALEPRSSALESSTWTKVKGRRHIPIGKRSSRE
jgi:hypothetical protein